MEYKVLYQEKHKVQTQYVKEEELDAFKKSHTIISIQKRLTYNWKITQKISNKEILTIFLELELMMRSHLTLYESLMIIHKSIKKRVLKEFIQSMIDAIYHGQSFAAAIKPFENNLDSIVVSFFKISYAKGNMYAFVQALCDVLQTKQDNQRLILSSLSYPFFIFISFCCAMMIIFEMVIPKFETVFIQYNLSLPFYTTLLLQFKSFVVDYGGLIFMLILFFSTFFYFGKYKKFQDEWLIKRVPFVGNIYKNYELHNLFVGLRVLTQSQYEFNVALENSQFLLKNQYLLDKIRNLQQHIHNGMSLYEAFLEVDLFDELVLNVIHSAQVSSKLNDALEKIEIYYKNRFTTMIKRLSSVIEPLFFVIMMLLILWVMLAIFTPIWNMSAMINL